MALSPNLSLVRVTGSYVNAQGQPAVGSVTFTLNQVLVDRAVDQIILNTPVVVNLVNGSFTVDLPATNDPDLIPHTDVWYTVTESVGVQSRPPFSLTLEHNSSPVNLADVTIVAGSPIPVGVAIPLVMTVNGVGPDAAGNVTVSGGSSIDTTDPEIVRDVIAVALRDGSGVQVVVDDEAETITISGVDATTTTKGVVQYGTTVGTAAQGNDSRLSDARTPTAHSHPTGDVTGLTESIQDNVGSMFTGGTHTGVAFVYDDATGKINATVTSGSVSSHDSLPLSVPATITWTGTAWPARTTATSQTGRRVIFIGNPGGDPPPDRLDNDMWTQG